MLKQINNKIFFFFQIPIVQRKKNENTVEDGYIDRNADNVEKVK